MNVFQFELPAGGNPVALTRHDQQLIEVQFHIDTYVQLIAVLTPDQAGLLARILDRALDRMAEELR